MKFLVFLSVAACKLTRLILRALKKGGTALPGKVALKICPDILGYLAKDVTCVAVTGTNGKTTSSRMLEQCFIESGYSYFANRSGANLLSGITAQFAAYATLAGKPKRPYAVIECDEAASKAVFGYIKPKCILVTNVFRDQLDRYGELSATLENIKTGIRNAPDAILCLNADCSMTASIAGEVDNEVIFYGVETEIYKNRVEEISDAPYCIHCKTEYAYDYITYGHLGGFYCPSCGYRRPETKVAVTNVLEAAQDFSRVSMRVFGESSELTINLPGGYNIYNAAGAVASAHALGIGQEAAISAMSRFECGFGRMEKFVINGRDVRMILIKNPAGCNQVLSFLTSSGEKTLFVVCLSDKIADGTDISWIWDSDFERLCDMGDRLAGVIVSGPRADDMALRFKYSGLPQDKLSVVREYPALIEAMASQDAPVCVMPTYTAMLELRAELAKTYGYKQFWE